MSDPQTLARFSELSSAGYVPSIGGWVQVAPNLGLSTVLNAFNTLGPQTIELFLMDQAGDPVHTEVVTVASFAALRLDLETIIPAASLPFEGSIWLWTRGATSEGSIGLQAVDLDFIDRARPEGYTAGSVHLMFDFLDTLQIPPYLDLVSPRLLAEKTPEGSDRFQNYLGLAQVPITDDSGSTLELTVSDQSGETMAAATLDVPMLGSWFGSLEALFGGLPEFLIGDGGSRGYGTLGVRDRDGDVNGLVGMLKVVDVVTGEMTVNHLNDRAFARPAQKDEDR
jgi:hypothetical protein